MQSKITTLIFDFPEYAKDDFTCMVPCNYLTDFVVFGATRELTADVAEAVMDFVDGCEQLEVLDLGGSLLSSGFLTALFPRVANAQLKRLHMDECGFDNPEAVEALASAIETTRFEGVEIMSFVANEIRDEGMIRLAGPLAAMKKLTLLSLESTSLSLAGVGIVCEALTSSTIESLSFGGVTEDVEEDAAIEAMIKVANFFAATTTLKSFELSDSNLFDRHVAVISEGLRCNKSLAELDLSGNTIGNRGFAALADALAENTTLEEIAFAGCRSDDDSEDGNGEGLYSGRGLEDLIGKMRGLKSLDISETLLLPEAAPRIFRAVGLSTTLESLLMDHIHINRLNDETLLLFNDCVRNSTSLKTISLVGSSIPMNERTIDAFNSNANVNIFFEPEDAYPSDDDGDDGYIKNENGFFNMNTLDRKETVRARLKSLTLRRLITGEEGGGETSPGGSDKLRQDSTSGDSKTFIVFNEADVDGVKAGGEAERRAKVQPEDGSTVLAALKLSILRTASALADSSSQHSRLKEVLEAIKVVGDMPPATDVPVKPSQKILNWGLDADEDVFLLAIPTESASIPPAERQIIRELKLRLLSKNYPSAEVAEQKIGGWDELESPSDSLQQSPKGAPMPLGATAGFLQGGMGASNEAGGDGESRRVTAVILPQYPRVAAKKRGESKALGLKDKIKDRKANLYVVFLSHAIVTAMTASYDVLKNAIDTWNHILSQVEKGHGSLLPVFLCTDGDTGSVIWKIQSRLNYALYLLHAQIGPLKPGEGSVKKAVSTIRRLFLFQGIVVNDIRQCSIVCEKMMNVLTEFTNHYAVFHDELEKIKKKLRAQLEAIGGLNGDACHWPDPIRDDEVAAQVGTLIATNSTWKSFSARFEDQADLLALVDVRNRQGAKTVIESLHLNPTIDVVRLAVDASYNLPGRTGGLMLVDLLASGLQRAKWDELSVTLPLKRRAIYGLVQVMRDSKSLKTLELINGMIVRDPDRCVDIDQAAEGIGSSGARLIADAVKVNTTLTRLNLSKNRFDGKGFKALAEMLSANKTLQALVLQKTAFDDGAIAIFQSVLKKSTTLVEFDISDNIVTDEGLKALSSAVKASKAMARLALSKNRFTGPGVDAFGGALTLNKSLVRVYIGARPTKKRTIQEKSLTTFLGNIKLSSVSELGLDHQPFKPSSVFALSSLLEEKPITKLILQDCSLSANDMVAIIGACQRHFALSYLDVSWNWIEDDGCLPIASFIEKSEKLDFLELSNTGITVKSFTAIAKALEVNRSLKTLIREGHDTVDVIRRLETEIDESLYRNRVLAELSHSIRSWKWAIENTSAEVIDYLLQLKGHEDFMTENRLAVISLACKYGSIETVRGLLKDLPEGFDWSESHGNDFTPLGFAINSSNVKLVELLANLDNMSWIVYTPDSTSAVYLAVAVNGNTEIGDVLIKHGASVEDGLDSEAKEPEKPGFTPLHYASLYGNLAIVQYLLRKCNANAMIDDTGATALHAAARGIIPVETDDSYAEAEEAKGIHVNRRANHAAVIKALVKAGVNVNSLDSQRKTPLDYATTSKQVELAKVLKRLGGKPGPPDEIRRTTFGRRQPSQPPQAPSPPNDQANMRQAAVQATFAAQTPPTAAGTGSFVPMTRSVVGNAQTAQADPLPTSSTSPLAPPPRSSSKVPLEPLVSPAIVPAPVNSLPMRNPHDERPLVPVVAMHTASVAARTPPATPPGAASRAAPVPPPHDSSRGAIASEVSTYEAIEIGLGDDKAFDYELHTLRHLISVHHGRHDDEITDDILDALVAIDERVRKELAAKNKEIDDTRAKIAEWERKWQDLATTREDNETELKEVAYEGWPADPSNYDAITSPFGYKYDFFISYRVAADSYLARELRLHLQLAGARVFLDQEELRDGEDWRMGFVRGLKNSKVVLFLVSPGCLARMHSSDRSTDNVLLEWETAMAAEELGFTKVQPIYIGEGQVDITEFPDERPLFKKATETDIFCRQSARKTLEKLANLSTDPLYIENPAKRLKRDLISALMDCKDGFEDMRDSKAVDRVEYLFEEMKIYFSGVGDDVTEDDLAALWRADEVEISRVEDKDLQKVVAILSVNMYWSSVHLKRQREKILPLLVKCIAEQDIITSLTFDFPSYGKDDFTELVPCNYLTDLILSGGTQPLTGEVANALMDFVDSCDRLRLLDFEGSHPLTSAFLCTLFPRVGGLTHLSLAGCGFDSVEAVETLAAAIENTGFEGVENINLANNSIWDEGFERLAGPLAAMKKLKRLSLGQTSLSLIGVGIVCKALTASSIKSLDFENAAMPEEEDADEKVAKAMEDVATFLAATTTLESFQLESSCLTDIHVEIFCKGLTKNKSLSELSLAGNPFGRRGFAALAKAFADNTTVTDISFAYCRSGSESGDGNTDGYLSGEGLDDLIKIAKGLRSLNLTGVDFLPAAAPLLFRAVSESTSLENLILDHVEIELTDEGVKLFNDCVRNSTALKSISLKYSTMPMDEDTIEAFSKNVNMGIEFEEGEAPSDTDGDDGYIVDEAAGFQGSERKDTVRSRLKTLTIRRNKEIKEDDEADGEEADTGESPGEEAEDELQEKKDKEPKKTILAFAKAPDADSQNPKAVAESAKVQPEDGSTRLSAMKLSILKSAAALADSSSQHSRLKEVLEAIHGFGDVSAAGELKPSQTHLRWELDEDEDRSEKDVFLLWKPTQDASIPLVEERIIRELQLRLMSEIYPSEDVEEESIGGWDDAEPDTEDNDTVQSRPQASLQEDDAGANFVDDAQPGNAADNAEDDDNNDDNGRNVTAAILPGYPQVLSRKRGENQASGPVGKLKEIKAGLYVVFLSHAIVTAMKSSYDVFWNTIGTWENLLNQVDKNNGSLLPVFLCPEGDSSTVIWKLQSRLNYALYLLSSQKGGLESKDAESTVKRAIDTIRRLFLFQGIVINDVRQCNIVCDKMMNVLGEFAKRYTGVHEELEKIKKNFRKPLETVGGLESDACEWPEPINDDEYAGQLGTLLATNTTWKTFTARFEEKEPTGSDVRNRQGAKALIEFLNQNSNIDVVRLAIDKSYNLHNKTDGLLLIDLLAKGLARAKWDELSITLPLHPKAIGPLISVMKEVGSPMRLELINGIVTSGDYEPEDQAGEGIGAPGAKLIADALKTNTTLTRLNLSKNRFNTAAFTSIADILSFNKTLKALILQRTSFNDEAVGIILNALKKNSTLSELDITDNEMTDEGLKSLSTALKAGKALSRLSISKNLLKGPGVEALGEALKSNKGLIRVDVGVSEKAPFVEEKSLTSFLSSVKQSNVTELSLDHQAIQRSSLLMLNTLIEMSRMKKLILQDCSLGAKEVIAVIEACSKHFTVAYLDLSWNPFEDEGCLPIAAFVEKSKNLEFLEISQTGITVKSFTALAKALVTNRSLKTLVRAGHDNVDEIQRLEAEIDQRLTRNRILASTTHSIKYWKWALENQSTECINYLNKLKGHEDFLEDNRLTVISFACKFGSLDAVRLLSKDVPKDFEWGVSYNYGFTPLGYAINSENAELVEFLMGIEGMSSIAYWPDSSNAFYLAVAVNGDTRMGDLLLKFGVDPIDGLDEDASEPEKPGFTALHYSSLVGNLAIVEYMLQHCDATAVVDATGATALHVAARGYMGTLAESPDEDEDEETKAADNSYKVNHAGVIEALLQAGLDVNALDEDRKTALDYATRTDLADLLKAAGGQPGPGDEDDE
ncbi:hypothetical protein HK101_005225 [Irineochytrium annulatum]|nr:hypothetical protein HK101_005225 [Irineochytrium annulatum]